MCPLATQLLCATNKKKCLVNFVKAMNGSSVEFLNFREDAGENGNCAYLFTRTGIGEKVLGLAGQNDHIFGR